MKQTQSKNRLSIKNQIHQYKAEKWCFVTSFFKLSKKFVSHKVFDTLFLDRVCIESSSLVSHYFVIE
jgi:hypothetical protein